MLVNGIRKENFRKKILEKKMSKKKLTKIFNKINQCDTIFALLAFLERNREKKN